MGGTIGGVVSSWCGSARGRRPHLGQWPWPRAAG